MDKNQHVDNKGKAELAIKKSAGTLKKISKMIQEDEYCPTIIQQVDAAIGLLKSAKKTLLTGHLQHCLHDKLNENKDQAVAELIKIFDLK